MYCPRTIEGLELWLEDLAVEPAAGALYVPDALSAEDWLARYGQIGVAIDRIVAIDRMELQSRAGTLRGWHESAAEVADILYEFCDEVYLVCADLNAMDASAGMPFAQVAAEVFLEDAGSGVVAPLELVGHSSEPWDTTRKTSEFAARELDLMSCGLTYLTDDEAGAAVRDVAERLGLAAASTLTANSGTMTVTADSPRMPDATHHLTTELSRDRQADTAVFAMLDIHRVAHLIACALCATGTITIRTPDRVYGWRIDGGNTTPLRPDELPATSSAKRHRRVRRVEAPPLGDWPVGI